MAETHLKECPDCNGRGYHKCPCWPADCICGHDDEDCERCDAIGLIDPDEEAYEEAMYADDMRYIETREAKGD